MSPRREIPKGSRMPGSHGASGPRGKSAGLRFDESHFETHRENYAPEFLRRPLSDRLRMLEEHFSMTAQAVAELQRIKTKLDGEMELLLDRESTLSENDLQAMFSRAGTVYSGMINSARRIFSNVYQAAKFNVRPINHLEKGFDSQEHMVFERGLRDAVKIDFGMPKLVRDMGFLIERRDERLRKNR